MDKISIIVKSLFICFCVAGILFTITFYWITNGKGSCKLCGDVGYSSTIEESRERGVFIRELDVYKIIPDTIELTFTKKFFLEEGFRYGEYNAEQTESLTNSDKYRYKIGMSPTQGENVKEPYLLYCETYKIFPSDTCVCEIWTRTPPFDSSYKVGELLLH